MPAPRCRPCRQKHGKPRQGVSAASRPGPAALAPAHVLARARQPRRTKQIVPADQHEPAPAACRPENRGPQLGARHRRRSRPAPPVRWSAVGLGGLGDGDGVAEGLELADVIAGLAALVGPGLVVAGSEVVVAGGGFAEQVPDDDQDGAGDGDPAAVTLAKASTTSNSSIGSLLIRELGITQAKCPRPADEWPHRARRWTTGENNSWTSGGTGVRTGQPRCERLGPLWDHTLCT